MASEAISQLDHVIALLRAGKSRESIRDAMGLSMWKTRKLIDQAKALMEHGDTVDHQVKTDLKLSKLKKEKYELEAKYKQLLGEIEDLQSQQQEVMELTDALQQAQPDRFEIKESGKPSQSTAFMIGSDWHLEETILPQQVNGLNEYNLDIASKRVERFFQNGLKLVDMCRSKSHIDTLVCALIGDLITGYIHEELVESNSLSPTQASLRAYELAVGGIDFLVENGNFKKIIVPCCYGNHGRTTQKPKVSTAAHNSYEWLMYCFLLKRYADHPIVSVKIPESYFNYLDVYGRLVRFHHGDGIRYNGGVGGVHVPLRKSIAQWNKARPVTLDVLGHWHTRQSASDYVINGSIIGYNAYSIRIKADYEPPQQTFFLMHPKRGRTVECPIHVD